MKDEHILFIVPSSDIYHTTDTMLGNLVYNINKVESLLAFMELVI